MAALLLRRVAAAGAVIAAAGAVDVSAQGGASTRLTRQQRALLQAVISAVDAHRTAPPSSNVEWPVHILRASDGAHYLAFSLQVDEARLPPNGAMVYVRLASRQPGTPPVPERSAVAEWLAGQRSDPLPMRPTRIVTVPLDELPVGGATSTARVNRPGSEAGQHSTALRLLEHQRERERQREEEQAAARRAALEGTAPAPSTLYPFEDFDVRATIARSPHGRAWLRRAAVAGAGDFDLYVAWADADASPRDVDVHVAKRTLRLPPATANGLALSSLILADDVHVMDRPTPSDAQTAHPYAIGLTSITPADDVVFTPDQRLAVMFQVINPAANTSGKPDVMVNFRIVRPGPGGETLVASLNPQHYHAEVLPADFDLARGHPLFVAMAAPLATLPRGEYRLQVLVSDRLSGRSTAGAVDFRIAATPLGLLREAPRVEMPRFERRRLLEPDLFDRLLVRLAPPSPSPALARALDEARRREFLGLLREEPVPPEEAGVRAVLRALTLYALGDAPATIAILLEQALRQSAPPGPTRALLGAARALDGQDRAAAAAWQAALDDGFEARGLVVEIVRAYLRAGDGPRAWRAAAQIDARTAEPDVAPLLATAALEAGEEAAALDVLDALPAGALDPMQVRFLRLRALFASFAHGRGPGATADGRRRFEQEAAAYIDAGGPHAALARDWLEEVRAAAERRSTGSGTGRR